MKNDKLVFILRKLERGELIASEAEQMLDAEIRQQCAGLTGDDWCRAYIKLKRWCWRRMLEKTRRLE